MNETETVLFSKKNRDNDMKEKGITAMDLRLGIEKKYPSPQYAVFYEVSDSTGRIGRYADAIAVSLYPSRGIYICGFEFKVTRSDWMRELRTPLKAESIATKCDGWYVVAPPGVVDVEEIPEAWGFMLFKDGRLRTKKKPNLNSNANPDRNFVAAILRQAALQQAQVEERYIRDRVLAQVELNDAKIENKYKFEIIQLQDQLAASKKLIADFEESTGINIALGRNQDILNPRAVEAVKFVLNTRATNWNSGLDEAISSFEYVKSLMDDSLRSIELLKGRYAEIMK